LPVFVNFELFGFQIGDHASALVGNRHVELWMSEVVIFTTSASSGGGGVGSRLSRLSVSRKAKHEYQGEGGSRTFSFWKCSERGKFSLLS
jgi:hypothetical protein